MELNPAKCKHHSLDNCYVKFLSYLTWYQFIDWYCYRLSWSLNTSLNCICVQRWKEIMLKLHLKVDGWYVYHIQNNSRVRETFRFILNIFYLVSWPVFVLNTSFSTSVDLVLFSLNTCWIFHWLLKPVFHPYHFLPCLLACILFNYFFHYFWGFVL